MEKVSVIVPVYNVEKYLDQCLKSLVNQTLKDIKIILVNDGSTDNSQSIIDKYQLKYPNLILALKKENGGLASARNFGLKYVQSNYVAFIDSDDYVDLTMYEKMYKKAIEENSDLVMCNLQYFFENNSHESFISKGLNLEWNNDPHKAAFLSPLFAWNKLYKKELFSENDLTYPIGLWYEDIPVSTKLFAISKKITWVNETLVYYRQRENSIMHAKYNPKMHDIFKILKIMTEELKRINKYDQYHDEIEYLFIEHCLYYGAFRFLRSNGYSQLITEGIALVNEYFPKWKDNMYLRELSFKNYFFVKTISSLTAPLYHYYLRWKK